MQRMCRFPGCAVKMVCWSAISRTNWSSERSLRGEVFAALYEEGLMFGGVFAREEDGEGAEGVAKIVAR